MHLGFFIVPLAVAIPVALYAAFVGGLTRAPASWPVALLRPPVLMLLLSPGIIAGHGVAIVPAGVALWQDLVVIRSSDLPLNAAFYAFFTFLALAFETWLTLRRRRAANRLRSNASDPDSASALRQLSGDP